MARSCFFLVTSLLISLVAAADVRLETLAITGERLPDDPGVFIESFGARMAQTADGDVVVIAQLAGAVTDEDDEAILRVGDEIEVLVREGDPMPGEAANFGALQVKYVAPNGDVLFTATRRRATTNGRGLFLYRGDGVELVISDWMPIPDVPTDAQFEGMQATMTSDGQVYAAILSGQHYRGIWGGFPGALRRIVGEGMQVPGMPPGVTFAWGGQAILDTGAHKFLIIGYIAGPGVTQYNDLCLWEYSDGALELLARTRDRLQGMQDDQFVDGLGGPGDMAAPGNFVFRADLPGGTGYRYGFWAGSPGALIPVALWNTAAPDAGIFLHLDQARVNRRGEVLFSAVMDAYTGPDYWSIWHWRPNHGLLRVARDGDWLPGLPDGYAVVQLGMTGASSANNFRNPTISSNGEIVFWALASGPGPSIHGLWTGNPKRGVDFALGTGTRFFDSMGFGHVILRPLNYFEINDYGQIAVSVRTTNGRTAILRAYAGETIRPQARRP